MPKSRSVQLKESFKLSGAVVVRAVNSFSGGARLWPPETAGAVNQKRKVTGLLKSMKNRTYKEQAKLKEKKLLQYV